MSVFLLAKRFQAARQQLGLSIEQVSDSAAKRVRRRASRKSKLKQAGLADSPAKPTNPEESGAALAARLTPGLVEQLETGRLSSTGASLRQVYALCHPVMLSEPEVRELLTQDGIATMAALVARAMAAPVDLNTGRRFVANSFFGHLAAEQLRRRGVTDVSPPEMDSWISTQPFQPTGDHMSDFAAALTRCFGELAIPGVGYAYGEIHYGGHKFEVSPYERRITIKPTLPSGSLLQIALQHDLDA